MNTNDAVSVNQTIELWKTTILTQQHFNTLQLQLRNVVLTLFVAVLTVAGYGVKEHIILTILGVGVPLAFLACLVGILVVGAFYYTDWGYHQLLLGAVVHGKLIETSLQPILPEALLTSSIKDASSKKKFLGFVTTNSEHRLLFFYLLLVVALAIAGLCAILSSSPIGAPGAGAAPPDHGILIDGTKVSVAPDSKLKVKVQCDATGKVQTIEITGP
jgi:hypothetical protein